MLEFVVSPVQAFSEEAGNEKWVEAMPARTYKTQMYGEVPITMEKLIVGKELQVQRQRARDCY